MEEKQRQCGVVTIIIPIYNVDAYLNRCIKNVVNQTYKKLEIILVDDGSSDNCPQICDRWAEQDSRIKVIHKKNAGLGMARNTGIENATGEYICFFDSDDYIELDTIEKAYNEAVITDAEIVLFGFYEVNENGKIKTINIPCTENLLYNGKEVQENFLPDLITNNAFNGKKVNLRMSVWECFFSMKLINDSNWRFVSEREIISEDIYSLLILYKKVNKVAILSEALYYYCENAKSLTHVYRKDRYEKIKYCYDKCIEVCNTLEYNRKVKIRLAYPYVSNVIGALKLIIVSNYSKKEKVEELRNILHDEHLQNVLSDINVRKETRARKVIILAMKWKWYKVCYLLVKIKTKYCS